MTFVKAVQNIHNKVSVAVIAAGKLFNCSAKLTQMSAVRWAWC